MSGWKQGTCESCWWWGASIEERQEDWTSRLGATCRKHAPNLLPGVQSHLSDTAWPITQRDDWCGDYETLYPEDD